MSPALVNPFVSFGSGPPPIDITEPWGEVARQETVSGGKLTIGSLNLSGLQAVRLFINGVTVTSDDTEVALRFIVNGSEVATGYRWGFLRIRTTVAVAEQTNSDTEISLTSAVATALVGNASTESFAAVVTVYDPGSTSLYKRAYCKPTWIRPDTDISGAAYGAGQLDNTGAITGFVLFGSSDLTGGSILVLGVE